MQSPVFPSELFIMIGINVFIALSLLASLFDKPFPKAVPYVYQIAALAGFGQLWINYTFLSPFVETRFWCSMLHLVTAVSNVIAVNVYIAIKKMLLGAASAFLGAVTIPTIFISFLSVSSYVNGMVIPMPPLPIVPVESIYIVFIVCTVILGLSMIAAFEPRILRKTFWIRRKRQLTPELLDFAVNPTEDDQKIMEKKGRERR